MKISTFCSQLLTALFATIAIAPVATAAMEETVIVTPGTLRQSVEALENVTSLIIKGQLNSRDLKYLHDCEGVMANIKKIDLSEITFDYDGGLYASCKLSSTGTVTIADGYFYLSENNTQSVSTEVDGLGWVHVAVIYKGNHLACLFNGNTQLTSVVLPKNADAVGDYMFNGCEKLTKVTLPESIEVIGETAFDKCGIKTFEMPPKLKIIGPWAFRNSMITSVDFPASLDSIGDYAFQSAKLESLDLKNVTKLGAYAFSGSKIAGVAKLGKIKKVPGYAFQYVTGLTGLVLPDGLESIENYAFYQDDKIKSLALPKSLKKIGDNAFAYCSNLAQLTYGDLLEDVAPTAFLGTAWIKNARGDKGVVYFGPTAYLYDSNTATGTLEFRPGTKVISSNFSSATAGGISVTDTKTTKLIFPSSVTTIMDGAFKGMSVMKTVEWPESLESIGANAFESCSVLSFTTFPESLTTIGENAFLRCHSIRSVTLHKNLKYIGRGAFGECDGIEECSFEVTHLKDKQCSPFSYNGYRGEPNNYSLQKLVIGSEVEYIPEYLTLGCYALNTIEFAPRDESLEIELASCALNFNRNRHPVVKNFPSNMRTIGSQACVGCVFETPVVLKNTEVIKDGAFASCSGIDTFVIPETVTEIGENAFSQSVDVMEVRATDLGQSWRIMGELGYSFGTDERLKKVIVGKDVKKLPTKMFLGCKGLEEVIFEERDSINHAPLTIESHCFAVETYSSEDNLVTEVKFPVGLERLYTMCFTNSMEKVILPSTMKNLDGAIWKSLKEIYCYAVEPPAISTYDSENRLTGVIAYVPVNSMELYKEASGWCKCTLRPLPHEASIEDVTADNSAPAFTVDGNVVSLAEECDVEVYTIDGRLFFSGRVSAFELPAGALYLLRINGTASKLSI